LINNGLIEDVADNFNRYIKTEQSSVRISPRRVTSRSKEREIYKSEDKTYTMLMQLKKTYNKDKKKLSFN